MASNLIPTLSVGAPWQLPLPSSLSPLAQFGVSNPTSLTVPAVGGSNYNATQGNTYAISTALATSMGLASYFQAKVQASAQYFLCENIHFQPIPLPAGSYDPNGIVQNLYAGYGYRIVIAFASASVTASTNLSDFAAQVQLNGAAFYALAISLGFQAGSVLDQDVTAINDIFTAGSGFDVDAYAMYQVALKQLNTDITASANVGSIVPTLVGADVSEAAITALCGLDFPSSVAYALNELAKGSTLTQATQNIATQKLPPANPDYPAITIDSNTVAAVYNVVQQWSPTSNLKGFASALKSIGS
jgi:hypothetical protein